MTLTHGQRRMLEQLSDGDWRRAGHGPDRVNPTAARSVWRLGLIDKLLRPGTAGPFEYRINDKGRRALEAA